MTNLIGIGHEKETGKDTVAKIIQCFTAGYSSKDTCIAVVENDIVKNQSNWENKKYADKLKDMVCLLIGCNREQLEDPQFKETPLGEEWWLINKPDENIFIPYTSDDWASYGDFENNLVKTTPRQLLQQLGTDVCRQIHPSMWVNALFADYQPKHAIHDWAVLSGIKWSSLSELSANYEKRWREECFPKWIISDVRFPDEAQAIKDRGGILVRVDRSGLYPGNGGTPFTTNFETGETDVHRSETALNDYEDWDAVIDNNGTIEELVQEVEEMLKHFKII
jgi:hypothetical protein